MSTDHKNLVALDIETSGLDIMLNKIISLALVPINVAQREEFGDLELYHDPGGDLNWDRWAYKNFERFYSTWRDISVDSVSFLQRLEAYLDRFDGKVTLVGHNIGSFDIAFLKVLVFPRWFPSAINYRSVDTHSLLYSLAARGIIQHKVCSSSGAFDFFGVEISEERRHTAIGDAEATAELYRKIILFEKKMVGQVYDDHSGCGCYGCSNKQSGIGE